MALAIGLDVGGTKVLGCLVAESGEVLAERRVATPQEREALLEGLAGLVGTLSREAQGVDGGLVGIGVGLPGLVDRSGQLHDTPNVPAAGGWHLDVDLGPALAAASGGAPRVVFENDGTSAAAGEFAFGAARGSGSAVVLTLGTGIGGGFVAGDRLVVGRRGFAGEVGHMVLDPAGPSCVCGSRGCFEQFASGTALGRLGRERAANDSARRLVALAGEPEAIRGEHVISAVRKGDADALAVIDVFARYLALGLSNLAEILDPGRVVLGGGLAEAADAYFGRTLEHFGTFRRGRGPDAVEVVIASLGERAGAVGAAAIALGLVTEGGP